jgi:pimeloyl-ACP methyl ester carboxylesterase
VLAEVDTVSAARAALAGGADGLVVLGVDVESIVAAMRAGADDPVVVLAVDPERREIAGADAVLGPSGRGRVVESPAQGRAAFAAGADLVVYDLAAAVDRLVAEIPTALPAPSLAPVVEPGGRIPAVLLSGMLGDASLWDGFAGLLSDAILPRPARIDRDDSVAQLAASVLAEAPPRFVLVGHSLGGIVALEMVQQAPQRVAGLVLVCTSARGPSEAQLQYWAGLRARTENGGFEAVAAELARATVAADRRDDARLIAENERMAQTVGAEGFLCQLAAQTTRPDSLASLGAMAMPVLVVSGGRDDICPPHLQRELADGCPTAESVTVDDAGHMLPLERPKELAALFREWLTRSGLGNRQ